MLSAGVHLFVWGSYISTSLDHPTMSASVVKPPRGQNAPVMERDQPPLRGGLVHRFQGVPRACGQVVGFDHGQMAEGV